MNTSFAVAARATAAAALMLVPPATPAAAQYLGGGAKTMAEVQLADLENLRDKFLALAGALPEETWSWRPMEGVRSVHEVMSLIAAEGTLFPTMWGFDKAAWTADGGFGPELQRLASLSREDVIAEMERSFAHLTELVGGLSEEQRAQEVNFFGLTVDLGTAVTLMANDMHEHLGQAIAYARTNEIVPPWSRPAEQGNDEGGEGGDGGDDGGERDSDR